MLMPFLYTLVCPVASKLEEICVLKHYLEEGKGLAHPRATFSFLDHSHVHLLICCLWLLSPFNDRVNQSLDYLLSGLLQKTVCWPGLGQYRKSKWTQQQGPLAHRAAQLSGPSATWADGPVVTLRAFELFCTHPDSLGLAQSRIGSCCEVAEHRGEGEGSRGGRAQPNHICRPYSEDTHSCFCSKGRVAAMWDRASHGASPYCHYFQLSYTCC